VTALGTQASEVALLVQAKQLTGSPLAVGLLGVVELVPLVVFGLYGGVLADRFDRRPLIRWCEAALGGCAVLLLVNALLPAPALWPLYAVTAVMMAAAALQRPSLDASVPQLVAREQLTAASALLSLSQNACFLALRGPPPGPGKDPGKRRCPAAQGSAGHRADGVLGRPVPTQGNDVNADKDRKILSV
jgi:MFS family permease